MYMTTIRLASVQISIFERKLYFLMECVHCNEIKNKMKNHTVDIVKKL